MQQIGPLRRSRNRVFVPESCVVATIPGERFPRSFARISCFFATIVAAESMLL